METVPQKIAVHGLNHHEYGMMQAINKYPGLLAFSFTKPRLLLKSRGH